MPPRVRDGVQWVARESGLLVLKEILKYALLTAGALAGAWVLIAVGSLFQIPADNLTWAGVGQRLWTSFGDLISNPYEYTVREIREDPVVASVGLLLTAGYIVLFVIVHRLRRALRLARVERLLAVQAGIGGRWPHARVDAAEGAPWKDLCADILRPDNTLLYILGANGAETFGEPNSPLAETLSQFRGGVRVVLCHPRSEQVVGRAQAVSVPIEQYRRAIKTSERRLADLRRQHHPVEGRFYSGQPNWKLIITDRTTWVQYYMPGGRHVNETPVWRFDATTSGSGLYHLFFLEFQRIWRRCEGDPMDL